VVGAEMRPTKDEKLQIRVIGNQATLGTLP
jgi:hypothetical protein